MIGHPRDPIHPFSDSDMLVRELPNARLVEASSILELRLSPERLTGEIVRFVESCFEEPLPPAGGRERSAGGGPLMSSRKEQKEALRQERLEREQAAQASQRRKQMVGYGVGGALALVAVVIVVVLLVAGGGDDGGGGGDVFPSGGSVADPGPLSADVEAAAEAAGCELKSNEVEDPLPDGSYHLQNETDSGQHKQNPPTSGLHYLPADDGLYEEAPTDEQLVHSLEHGRVIIWAKPSLPKNDRAALAALFEQDDLQLILVPRTEMPFAVAATAWNGGPPANGTGRLIGCPQWNDEVIDALRAFRDEHRARGPEPVP